MTKKDILIVANRILGIYLLIRAFESLQIVGMAIATLRPLSLEEEIQDYWFLIGTLIPFLLLIVAAFCLIKWADLIATKLCHKDKPHEIKKGIKKEEIQEVAFSAVGVFIIANALPRITQIVINFSYQGELLKRKLILSGWSSLAGLIVQLIIGFFLIFGSKGLVQLIQKCRRT